MSGSLTTSISGDARSIDVQQAIAFPIGLGAMNEPGDVLLQVDPGYADLFLLTVDTDHQTAIGGKRHVVLRDLVALHEIGVGVVLSVELRLPGNRTVKGQARGDSQLHRPAC